MSGILTATDFVPHVGKVFAPKGQRMALTLVSVDTIKTRPWPGMPREPFTLILRGPPGDVLPEGLHEVAVADGPDFCLHIMPIYTPARDRQDYQAVFN